MSKEDLNATGRNDGLCDIRRAIIRTASRQAKHLSPEEEAQSMIVAPTSEKSSEVQEAPDIAPALSALNALHRADIVNLLANLDSVVEMNGNWLECDDAAMVLDIRKRWDSLGFS